MRQNLCPVWMLKFRCHSKPQGEVVLPAFTCGFIGALLTITLSILGWHDGLNVDLKAYYIGPPFYMPETSLTLHFFWEVMIVVLLSFGVSYAVLDIDRKWRRVMVFLLLSVVVIFSSPVLMLWDVFWSPVMVFVGVLWSWMCAFIYSCQHIMPCELLLENQKQVVLQPQEKEENEVIVETEEQQGNVSENILESKVQETSMEKYQPKQASSCPD
jgi:hypothetical protein